MMREIVSSLFAFMLQLDDRVRTFDRTLAAIFKASKVCQRIAKIRGIGPKTATAMIAAIGDGSRLQERPAPGGLARALAG
jgi:transposase